jgi:L-ascorbate metabolism protein UlaG (beta-lactamase superfamily)
LKRFPLSDHCDGTRFFNPPPEAPKRRRADLLRWRLQGNRAAWPDWVVDPVYPPPPAAVLPGQAAITFIGHSSFLIHLAGLTLLTDPIFSDRCSPVGWAGPKRHRAPGLALAALPPIDFLLVSHNHYDHMDLPSLRALYAGGVRTIVTSLGNAGFLARAGLRGAQELDWWDATRIGDATITATPARHFAARTPFDTNRTLWAGFMIEHGGVRILFAGDSGSGPHFLSIRERLGAPHVALLPIGAYEPRWFMQPVHMNPAEAVAAHDALGSARSIGMHFGTFQLTDEAIDAPLHALAAARGDRRFETLGFGETVIV